MRLYLTVFSFLLYSTFLSAQAPVPPRSAAEVQMMLKKLNVLGTVMYLAAHPDDENTRLIAYFAGEKGYRTGYLSLTRGDGGQNLIGDEKGSLLGILRTQELLSARRIDGGMQMFSRAIDFGYSKNPEETLEIWDKDKVLADVVWAIRKFRPDVIVTRFPGPEKGGGGHGHHTASNILGKEAYHLAADPNAYPEQLKYVDTWQVKRIVWNTWRPGRDPNYDFSKVISVDIGTYNPVLGKSYGEIGIEARSMHRCQAFGSAPLRGSRIEYMEHELGEKAEKDLFEGIDSGWGRVGEAEGIGALLQKAYEEFMPAQPHKSIPVLLQAYEAMAAKEGHWYDIKREDLKMVIAYCAGLWFEASASQANVANGDSVEFIAQVLKRGEGTISWNGISYSIGDISKEMNEALATNDQVSEFRQKFLVNEIPVSQPYWLEGPGQKGIFSVEDPLNIGLPQNNAAATARFNFTINGQNLEYEIPVIYKYVDRAIGELFRPFSISPPITTNLSEKVFLFPDARAQKIDFVIKSHASQIHTDLSFDIPDGWKVSPETLSFDFEKAGEEKNVSIQLIPPSNQSVGQFRIISSVNGQSGCHSLQEIAYDHIPTQMVFNPAEARVARIDIQKKGNRIGYIMGSGDEVPKALKQIGYEVEILEDDQLSLERLESFDAIVAGIRAYNRNPRMPYHHEVLMDYVQRGGTYIVQYNTTYGLQVSQPGPYPLKLSRDRVTVEEAEMRMIADKHPVLNIPNQITEKDFDNWVQERGLYFPNEWDAHYTPILEANDPGETAKQGALLVAQHGQGWFVYTGISFFRELPAGVPGAFRLFANMVSLGNEEK